MTTTTKSDLVTAADEARRAILAMAREGGEGRGPDDMDATINEVAKLLESLRRIRNRGGRS